MQPDSAINAVGSSNMKLSVEWDSNSMTLTAVIGKITKMSMVELPKMKGSFAGDNKVPDLSADWRRHVGLMQILSKYSLSTAIDKEPYKAIMTMEATDIIRSEDSLSSFDPLVHSKVVCMLVTRFVSSYNKAEQFQLWQQLKQQPDQTVKVFLTKVSSMAAIGGYQCSTALLTMATALTPKAVATSAKCRELQIAESQKESIDGTTRSTIMNLLDILVEEAYIYKEDVLLPFNVSS